MRSANIVRLLQLAEEQASRHDLSKAVDDCREARTPGGPRKRFDSNKLRAKIEALGYEVVVKPLKFLTQVDVTKGGGLVASGTSEDELDALLHAMLGYVRERRIDELVAGGMSKAEAVQKAVVN